MTNVWTRAADYAFPKEEQYLQDPVLWAKERAGIHLWSKQRDIIESVRDHPETAVHSCHNAGKSALAAVASCWWIDAHPPGSAFIVTTAPTAPQVKAILWREIGRIHRRAGLSGRTNLTEWYLGGELVGYGRKPDDKDPTGFQGIHAEHVLVVLDEACGLPKALWDAASSLTSNDGSRTLAIGNPDDPHSEFADICKPGSGWSVVHIGWEHTPNATNEQVPDVVRKSLISSKWVESRVKRWTKRSSLYRSKVEGLFPTDSERGMIPWSWLVACRQVQLAADGKRCAGLDVGGGGDRTVLRERVGPRAGREETWDESDPMRLAGDISLKLQEWDIERVVVDVVGIGWGLAGVLKERSRRHNLVEADTVHNAEVVAFNAAETSNQPRRFANKRAEVWWEVGRELSRLGTWDLEDVDDDVFDELVEPTYKTMDSFGKIKLEPKDDIRKRLGHSPDRADALLMAFWEGDSSEVLMPASAAQMLGQGYQTQRDLGIAGPRRQATVPAGEPDQDERRVLQEVFGSRPV